MKQFISTKFLRIDNKVILKSPLENEKAVIGKAAIESSELAAKVYFISTTLLGI